MSAKFETQLRDANLDATRYYRFGNITVCLLIKERQVLARGVSVCSPKDQFVKNTGKVKALGKAMRAYINKGGQERLRGFPHFMGFNSLIDYEPVLTEREQKILERVKEGGTDGDRGHSIKRQEPSN